MANELRHTDVGNNLSKSEWEAIGTHIFNNQAKGDIPYASSATQISRRGIGSTNEILTVIGGVPTWTATPTLTGLTIGASDLDIGANLIKTTSYALKDDGVYGISIRNVADTADASIWVDLCRFVSALEARSSPARLEAQNADGGYLVFKSRDTGVGLVEIARLQGAAEPWFGMGKDSDVVKATYDDKLGFYSTTPIAKQAGVAVSAAGIHAALVNLGLIAA